MSKWNTASMHAYLQKAGVQGEPYKYPVYCTIENTSFFANAYNVYLKKHIFEKKLKI